MIAKELAKPDVDDDDLPSNSGPSENEEPSSQETKPKTQENSFWMPHAYQRIFTTQRISGYSMKFGKLWRKSLMCCMFPILGVM